MIKEASVEHPIHELIAKRWSPYGYSDRPVSDEDLCSLFEAARWAPSSYNEQPWSYIIARKENSDEFEQLLSCLVEANQAWARQAPVLVLGIVTLRFSRNDKLNAAAEHDLGLAAGNLCIEAADRGISIHQMIGILPDRAREIYEIPEGSKALTGIAIGYAADTETLSDAYKERDLAPRKRKQLKNFVFSGKWDVSSELVG